MTTMASVTVGSSGRLGVAFYLTQRECQQRGDVAVPIGLFAPLAPDDKALRVACGLRLRVGLSWFLAHVQTFERLSPDLFKALNTSSNQQPD
jgi:hypothetical protein